MAPVTRMKGGLDLGGTKIQAVVTDGESTVLGRARRETPRRGSPEAVVFELAETLREALDDAGVEPMGLAGIGVGAPGSIDVATGTVLQVPNIDGWDAPFPLGPALADRAGAARQDRQRRQRRGRGRAPVRGRPGLRVVPRRLLGHRRRRRHRHRRKASRRPRVGRRDRPRLLEARRAPLQLRARRLRRGVRRTRRARGARPRAREGASDDPVRADGEARPRPAHERRLAARAPGGGRGRRGADPARRPGARGRASARP